MSNIVQIQPVSDYLIQLQATLCTALAKNDNQTFITDHWQRAEGGGGCSRILENGEIFEKAGVNYSHVYGKQLPDSATAAHPELVGRSFQAVGVSIVVHPRNPYVPTTHANVRFFYR